MLACVAVVAIYAVSLAAFQADERRTATARASLYDSSLRAEVARFRHLPPILAEDVQVRNVAQGAPPSGLNTRLARFAAQAGVDAIYLMDRTGETIAASNAGTTLSFLGQSYGFRPYFQAALSGEEGTFYGIGATTRRPGYFIASPVRATSGDIAGVLALKLDLGELSDSWRAGGEKVMLVNSDGIVVLASDPAWLYHTLSPLSDARRAEIASERQFADEPLPVLAWAATGDAILWLDGQRYTRVVRANLPEGWSLHYLGPLQPAASRALLTALLAVLLAGAFLVGAQRRRARATTRALSASREAEAQLRRTNAQLAHEIDERKIAETKLRRTQRELERASKLAALGHLAASVTHELGQPIAAMKNHLLAAELGGNRVAPALSGLVERMEGITRQLKFFARPGNDQFGAVEMPEVLDTALDLVGPSFADVAFVTDVAADDDLVVRGDRLRLEQIVVNLLRNAAEAASDTTAPQRVDIGLNRDADGGVRLSVVDSGPGLNGQSIEALSEPFVSTRASGEGMGLGLAISMEIAQEHDGSLTARDRTHGTGAEFVLRLPAGTMEQVAAQ
ncbi:MAG: ATP-binding protein [Pseudomonadota bacterium]